METFTLSRKELHRPGLLKALCGGRLTNAQVAAALRITVRQVRRLKRRFEAGGAGALVHDNRDRPSPRRLPGAARGALIQIDGSPFPWLEDRGAELMLLGAMDDVTSEILALQFRPAEDVHGYVTLFRDVFTAHGLPMAVYGDRLNLLVRNDAHWSVEEQLAGTQAPTHVGRILQNLAIGYIAARSPQAKGRIERLWNTLQDRLVSELRLRGIRTVEAAQAYLAEFIADFNQRFGKPPADRQAVWRRPPRDLALRLGCGYRRPRRVGRARPLPQRLPRLAPNTHTGRRPLATHPWRRAQAAAIRLHEARTGRTFSRRSDGGPNH